ncbi:hypothetical protein [Wocania ichthyoenteri]|uniref:hypothetical protein n=1 Tax=Wocania ichthyoenteri TaxID=1230531 RepID=UPI0012E013E3|nr:hypothetical protein [Wocania ichthyoenteri]
MKTKTKTYTLLTLVLGIWGVIGYKILSAVNPTSPEFVEQNLDVSFNPKARKETDTFSIKPVNRDPFLGTLLIKKKTITKNPKHKTTVVWKPIIYHGNVSNQNGKTKVFIISIDGQQHLIKPGQVINEVKLIKGNSKSVLLSYKGVRKNISKS